MTSAAARRQLFKSVSRLLGRMSDSAFAALLAGAPIQSTSWGQAQSVYVDGTPVFIKRVPVTAQEGLHQFSTDNVYQLPLAYHYGVGSAGFGAGRELVTHLKTTAWVLEGAQDGFPLLYHWRLVPRSSGGQARDPMRTAHYLARWDDDPHIARYLRDRSTAPRELVFCLEHFPYTLEPWLASHSHATPRVVAQLMKIVGFLRQQGIVHFDAHFQNVVTDGAQVFLTDFGLALDEHFDMTAEERRFLHRHRLYDSGYILASLLAVALRALQPPTEALATVLTEQHGLAPPVPADALARLLLDQMEPWSQAGLLPLNPNFVSMWLMHRDIIALIGAFLTSMSQNPKKDTPFPEEALRELLVRAGVVAL